MKRLTLLLAVVLQLNAPGQSYKYEISHYPKRGSCHALASALAANVSEHLSTPAIGRCVDIGKSDFSIEIRYEADKELPIHSTYSSLSLIYDFSDYATETECNDALPGWVTMFERNTELTPLVAYCFNQHSSPGFKLNWAVRIDGIGKAVKRPVVRGMLIHGAPVDYPGESFVNAVKEKLEPAGVEFAHARFNYRAAEYQLDLVYYTGGPSLDSGRIAEYLNVGDCEAERESLNGMFGDSPSFIF
ncbi:MAG: hypothetical protein KDD51_16665, partial [Bdellovibrionales bacterium]|nr:hypothetical protein [Bdellovibrionales bacterium]